MLLKHNIHAAEWIFANGTHTVTRTQVRKQHDNQPSCSLPSRPRPQGVTAVLTWFAFSSLPCLRASQRFSHSACVIFAWCLSQRWCLCNFARHLLETSEPLRGRSCMQTRFCPVCSCLAFQGHTRARARVGLGSSGDLETWSWVEMARWGLSWMF